MVGVCENTKVNPIQWKFSRAFLLKCGGKKILFYKVSGFFFLHTSSENGRITIGL